MYLNTKFLLFLSTILCFETGLLYAAEVKKSKEDPIFEIFDLGNKLQKINIGKLNYYNAVNKYIQDKKDINIKNKKGQSLLMKAIYLLKSITYDFINSIDDYNFLDAEISKEEMKLRAENDKTNLLNTIDLLIQNGADLNAVDNDGKTIFNYLIVTPNLSNRLKSPEIDKPTEIHIEKALQKRKETIKQTLSNYGIIVDLANIVCSY